MVKIDGQVFDIPPAVRCFHKYDSDSRALHQASFRMGYLQKNRIGEFFWTHPLVPSVAFPTKARALRAAIAALNPSPLTSAQARD